MIAIKDILTNLQSILLKDAKVSSLVGSRVYISEDIIKLANEGKLPAINIELDTIRTEDADNMGRDDYERYTVNINLQFIISNKSRTDCLVGTNGLLDFYTYIYEAIKKDETIKNTVDGLIKPPSLITDIFPPSKENLLYVGGGEMGLQFSKDVFVR